MVYEESFWWTQQMNKLLNLEEAFEEAYSLDTTQRMEHTQHG